MPMPNFHSATVFPKRLITGECGTKTAEMHGKEVLQIFCQRQGANRDGTKWALQAVRFDRTIWQPAEVKGICEKEGWRFEEAEKKVEKSDLPPGEWVAKREIVRSQNGSAIFVKTEGNPDSDYPIIRGGEVSKRDLADYEYLLHHAHLEGESEERLDHCLLFDHLGNAFEIEHLQKGQEIYHIVKGLEPNQSVAWSDEEAKQKGIEPKQMKAGMSFEQKAEAW